ncbi:MAG: nitrite reductase small subunit NirD [Pseudomonadota bacterium]|nr:nitrite reductase small subunit NirD [Pseudomonadota bacterium]
MTKNFIPPEWLDLGPVGQVPLRGARSVPVAGGEEIAIFRTGDDRVYALVNRCPHKGGPLSQGIVHGDKVACPLHDWKISLVTGEALAPDQGCVPTIPVKVVAGRIFVFRAAVIKEAA